MHVIRSHNNIIANFQNTHLATTSPHPVPNLKPKATVESTNNQLISDPFSYRYLKMTDSLLSRIANNSKAIGNKVALSFLGSGANGGVIENSFTYHDIASETDKLALNLISSGLKKGDL